MTEAIPQNPVLFDDDLLKKLTNNLSAQQQIWLSGYLFGIAQIQNRTNIGQQKAPPQYNGAFTPVAEPSVVESHPQAMAAPTKTTILFGSQSGNAKKAANQTAELLRSKGLDISVVDMADYKPTKLKDEKSLLVVVATYGEGEPPAAAEELHKFLFSSRAPKLADTQFSVLALGDKSYLQYCQTGKDFDTQLEKLGGKRLAGRVDCDVDWHDDAEKWMDAVSRVLSTTPQLKAVSNGQGYSANENGYAASLVNQPAAMAAPKFDRKNPYAAEVLEKIQLNGRGSVKETWHIELTANDLYYQAGDALHILPTNSERIVADVLAVAKIDPSVKVDFDNQTLSLGEVLLEKAELTVLTRDVLTRYHDLTKNETLKSLLDDPKAIQNYTYGRDVADLLKDFPTELSPQYLAQILRKMPSRAYSIASSLAAHPDEVHLTVGAVRYKAQGRKKEGVASTFLADRLAIGETVKVFVEQNEFFKPPKDPSAPMIMVGPGTGIAPFRAFVEERIETGATGKNWLFFGNPNFTTDFLYQTEWQQYLKTGGLTHLDVAFSRDQQEKIYVQHRLMQQSKRLFDWLQNGAYFYVCGDKNKMAGDVERALIQVAIKEGQYAEEQASAWVKDLKKSRRYLEDVY
jgi:sulfite reductase (NADPH) flavoprotein alpha-component